MKKKMKWETKVYIAGIAIPVFITLLALAPFPQGIKIIGDLVFQERSAVATTPVAGTGTIYVKNTTPSTVRFVDDTGAEITLGAAGSGGAHTIEEEGTSLTARTKLNFVGAGVTATDDAGDDATVVTIASGGGDVSKVGTPVDGQIGIWTGDGTIEGDSALTFDTTDDTVVVAASGKLAFGAVDILSDAAGTTTLDNVDALGATTESTVEAAIDTLANLTSIQGQSVTVSGTTTVSGTNTGNVTLAGARDYLVIASQEITLGPIDLSGGTDVTGDLPLANIAQIAQSTLLGRAAGAGTGDVTALAHLAIQTLLNTASAVTSTTNSVAWNSDNARVFTHTLTENTTIAASSGTPFDGQLVLFAITQAAGSYTLAWNAQFAAGEDYSDTIPAMSTTNGNLDFYLYFYSSGKTKFILLDQMAY